MLAVTVSVLAFPGDSVWILGAGSLRRVVRSERVTRRVSGGLLIGAGAGLALARRA